MQNLFKNAPAWVTNTFAIVLSLLLFINTIGPDLLKFVTDIECQPCIHVVNVVLGVVGSVLGFYQAFSKVDIKINNLPVILILSGFLATIFYQGNAREIRLLNKPPSVSWQTTK